MNPWRAVSASNYIVPCSFSVAATGVAVGNRWSAGRRGPYVIGPARPQAATPGNRGPSVALGGAAAPSRASRKRPKRLPALNPHWGNGKKGYGAPAAATKQGRRSVG